MGISISGLNDYSSMMQSYRVPSIPSVSVEEVQRQDRERAAQDSLGGALVAPSAKTEELPISRKNSSLEDISLTFNKMDDFGTIGRDSDILSLDVENAISDMQKDKVLQQYQFFAGSAGSFGGNDGIVIPKYYPEV